MNKTLSSLLLSVVMMMPALSLGMQQPPAEVQSVMMALNKDIEELINQAAKVPSLKPLVDKINTNKNKLNELAKKYSGQEAPAAARKATRVQ